jgi:epoxyqueuosine reductase QueG
MLNLEENVKKFAKKAGASLVGIAGQGRFDGPPSIDPTYIMKGAKSVISIVIPLSVPAIYDFLGKKSAAPHNIDQAVVNQRMHRIATEVAGYLVSLGHRAAAVPQNNTYRRALDPFATRPTFSHRFAAVVSGLGTFGLSGNVVTKEYGASVVLDSVVTSAVLESDSVLPPRLAMDDRCHTCKICEKTCTMGMFRDDDEEYLLLNGELHPRGKRKNIDFCNAPCFGLHGISRDKKWTNWGQHWIKEWMDAYPDPQKREEVRLTFMKVGARAGDSTERFDAIRHIGMKLYPREVIEDYLPEYDNLPRDEEELCRLLEVTLENIGFKGLKKDPYLITCSQCMMVCGPDFEETKKRYDLLMQGGYVVPGADWKMMHAKTFEEAAKLKAKYPRKVSRAEMRKDSLGSGNIWVKDYFGFEPISEFKNWLYQRKAQKACVRAGLAGKEAKPPILVNPGYMIGLVSGGRGRKRKGK